MEDKIIALIESKSWEQLSLAEREIVLSHMTEEGFITEHTLVMKSQALFDEEAVFIVPDPSIFSSLKQHTKQPASAPWWILVFEYKMPAYQGGLSLVALAILVWVFWPQPKTQFIEKEVLVYENVYDTLEVEVIKEVPVERIVTVIKEIPMNTPTSQTEYAEASTGITPQASPIRADAISQNFANTSLNDGRLSQFMVGVK